MDYQEVEEDNDLMGVMIVLPERFQQQKEPPPWPEYGRGRISIEVVKNVTSPSYVNHPVNPWQVWVWHITDEGWGENMNVVHAPEFKTELEALEAAHRLVTVNYPEGQLAAFTASKVKELMSDA